MKTFKALTRHGTSAHSTQARNNTWSKSRTVSQIGERTLVRDPGAEQRAAGNKYIKRLSFFGRDLAVWAQVDGGGTTLRSERDHLKEEVYPRAAVVTSTVFNNKVVFVSRDYGMYQYDGFSWKEIDANSDPRPAYAVSIQRRLAIAGMPGKRTIIDFSRVDKENVFTDDEDDNATQVTKAADIDVGNIIGTADEIKGLGVFENSRLAVFTNDQTLVYQLHPDYTQWQIDDKANIKTGCISHNTITQAGADLLFCSRDGVHSLRRSETNGITIYTVPMSNKIDLIYRDLLRNVADHETISAFYDQDEGQYHIFFPFSDQITKRLTLSLNPMQGGESKWSSGEFLNATCGVQLGGQTLLGTPGGVWEKRIEDITTHSPEMVVLTPILWQGLSTTQRRATALSCKQRAKESYKLRRLMRGEIPVSHPVPYRRAVRTTSSPMFRYKDSMSASLNTAIAEFSSVSQRRGRDCLKS